MYDHDPYKNQQPPHGGHYQQPQQAYAQAPPPGAYAYGYGPPPAQPLYPPAPQQQA